MDFNLPPRNYPATLLLCVFITVVSCGGLLKPLSEQENRDGDNSLVDYSNFNNSRCPESAIAIKEAGILTSPRHVQKHNVPFDCRFDIDAGKNHMVHINFISIRFYSNSQCNRGKLVLEYSSEDGRSLSTNLCCTPREVWTSTSQFVSLHFEASSDMGLGEGFTARIEFVPQTSLSKDSYNVKAASHPICPPVILTAESGTIASTNFPNNYENDLDCYWTITKKEVIEIRFETFDVESEASCAYDSLTLYDGPTLSSPLIGSYCSSSPPPPKVVSSASSVLLHFLSDNMGNQKGFKLEYSSFNQAKQKQHQKCGSPSSELQIDRLRGPSRVEPMSAPWHVSILRNDEHICSGAILSDSWVITAGHCVTSHFDYQIRTGTRALNVATSTSIPVPVWHVFHHPDYKEDNLDNDLALLQLEHSLTLGDDAMPICLPPTSAQEFQVCSVSGWPTHSDDPDGVCYLSFNHLPILQQTTCNSTGWYEGKIKDSMFCAGYPEPVVRACKFLKDHGSPLVCPTSGNEWYLSGILSWNHECGARNKPTVFADVHLHREWMENIMEGPDSLAFEKLTIQNQDFGVMSALGESCGRGRIQPVIRRMFNAETAVDHSWPWQVRVLASNLSCSGSIIGDRWLLTSAGCIQTLKGKPTILAGDHLRSRHSQYAQERIVESMHVHPYYNQENQDYNLALLRVKCPFAFSAGIWPVCLPVTPPQQNQLCVVTGWRRTHPWKDNPDSVDSLEQAVLPVMLTEDCRQRSWYSKAITESMLCAGYPEGSKAGCTGDAGGPLVCYDGGIWKLAGVSSFGPSTCNIAGLPAVFTDVYKTVDWITNTVATEFEVPYSLGVKINTNTKNPHNCRKNGERLHLERSLQRSDTGYANDLAGNRGCRCKTRPLKLYGTHGHIQSAQFPNKYPDFVTCKWVIKTTSRPIKLLFYSFGIEPAEDCEFDSLVIFTRNGRFSKTLCGSSIPDQMVIDAKAVYIQFKSDVSVTNIGFDIAYFTSTPIEMQDNYTKPEVPEVQCGVPFIINMMQSRILGGLQSTPNSWPWQVSLQYDRDHFCGGTVLSSSWVLTAGHCVAEIPDLLDNLEIIAGAHNLKAIETRQQIRIAESFVLHPGYRHTGLSIKNDIALLKLQSPFTISNYVKPVCLTHVAAPDNTMCTITGWGFSGIAGTSTVLQEAMVPILPSPYCNQTGWYGGRIDDKMMCAGYAAGGIDACTGDSGGPLVHDIGGRFVLHGITSWGYGCARPKQPGVYTRVEKFIDWIDSITSSSVFYASSTP